MSSPRIGRSKSSFTNSAAANYATDLQQPPPTTCLTGLMELFCSSRAVVQAPVSTCNFCGFSRIAIFVSSILTSNSCIHCWGCYMYIEPDTNVLPGLAGVTRSRAGVCPLVLE